MSPQMLRSRQAVYYYHLLVQRCFLWCKCARARRCDEGGNTQCCTIFFSLLEMLSLDFFVRALNRWSSYTVWDFEVTLGAPSKLRLTYHHRESHASEGPSLSGWRTLQSGYGSVLTAIWREIPFSSSCCWTTLGDSLQSVSEEHFFIFPINKHTALIAMYI